MIFLKYVLVSGAYITRLKRFKSTGVLSVVGSIVVVGALTNCTLCEFFNSYDLFNVKKGIVRSRII